MKVGQDIGKYYSSWNSMNTKNSIKEKKEEQSQVSVYSTSSKKKQKKSGIVVKKDISASKYFLRLANARSAPRVNGIIRAARADMNFVRSSGSSQQQIERALRILKKVVAKGSIKVGRLKNEQQMKGQKEMMEKLGKERKVKDLQRKLRSKKNSRKLQERADTTDLDSVTIESRSQRESYEERIAAYQSLSNETDSTIDISVSDTVQAAEVADIGAVDISI